MDNLTKDALAAESSGLSYGKYKAINPNTKENNPFDKYVPCKVCGKLFLPRRKNNIYCSIECCAQEMQQRRTIRKQSGGTEKEDKK